MGGLRCHRNCGCPLTSRHTNFFCQFVLRPFGSCAGLRQGSSPLFQHPGAFHGVLPSRSFPYSGFSGNTDTFSRVNLGWRCLRRVGRPPPGTYILRDALCRNSLHKGNRFLLFLLTCHCRWYCHCFVTGSPAGNPSHLHFGSLVSSEYRAKTRFEKSKWVFCLSNNTNFKFCFIIPIPPYLKEFGHLLHIICTFELIFSPTISDNSDEKKSKCILPHRNAHTHTSMGGSEMFAEKLRMIPCHLYRYLFHQAREYWADFKSSFQFSSFSLLDEMSTKPIILPPYTTCRQKAFGQMQASKQ